MRSLCRTLLCAMLLCSLCLSLLAPPAALAEEDLHMEEAVLLNDDGSESPDPDGALPPTAREDFINRIIALGEKLYHKSGGKAQRAHYAGDIYVCKNFTVYLFRQNRDDFRMEAFPDTQLVIPNNLPARQCKPYAYGIFWEDVPAEKGNPFEVAAQFTYNSELSHEENMELACDFLRQAQRGDFFQMSADYDYGVGAHSAIMLGYDADEDTIHWMDSNMRGKKVDGIRYGIVQFDEVKPVTWWADAFCVKKRGATLYRLRSDIIYAEDTQHENK